MRVRISPYALMKFILRLVGSPIVMRRANGWFTLFWIAMIPISLLTGWIGSVTYVAVLSLWALVASHWSAWQAAQVGETQAREAEERLTNPVEEKVVEKIIETTTLEKV